jgi:hypothetical protein
VSINLLDISSQAPAVAPQVASSVQTDVECAAAAAAPATRPQTPVEIAKAALEAYLLATGTEGAAGAARIRAAKIAGIKVIPVLDKVENRGRQRFIREHLSSSKTTVNVCIRIAKAGDRVDAYLDGAASKSKSPSISGLLRFLGPEKPPSPKRPPLAVALAKASVEEIEEAFKGAGFEKLSKPILECFHKQLQDQYDRQQLAKPKNARVKKKDKSLIARRQGDGSYSVPIEEAA